MSSEADGEDVVPILLKAVCVNVSSPDSEDPEQADLSKVAAYWTGALNADNTESVGGRRTVPVMRFQGEGKVATKAVLAAAQRAMQEAGSG